MNINELLKIVREKNLQVFLIGASSGGVEALMKILPAFKKPSRVSVLVVLHMSPTGENLLPELLSDGCSFSVKEAISGEVLKKEVIYIAPPDYHLALEPDLTLSLNHDGPINFSRPAIDFLFEESAYSLKGHVVGILLTGANHDGAFGLKKIHDLHGLTIVQDPEEAEFPTMPMEALRLEGSHFRMKLTEIVNFIEQITEQ